MNPTFIQRVAKLVPYPVKHATVPALAFAYHFEPPVEQNLQLGSLFVAIEVMAKDPLASQVVDLIIKTIGEEYYNKKFTAEAPHRFEKAVTELNKHLAQLLSSRHGQDINGMSAVIGVLNGTELYITQCGKARANLYRGGKQTELSAGLSEGSTPAKLFHGIAEGTLKQKDKLLFTTPALLFQFSEKALQNMIQDNSPAGCVNKIGQQLADEDSKGRCAAILVELTSPEEAAEQPLSDEPGEVMLGKPQTKVDEVKAAALPHAKRISGAVLATGKKGSSWLTQSALPSGKQHVKRGWNAFWTRYVNPSPKRALLVALVIMAVVTVGTIVGLAGRTDYRALTTSYKEVIALTDSAEAKQSLNQEDASRSAAASANQKLSKLVADYTPKQIATALRNDNDLRNKAMVTPSSLQKRLTVVADKLDNISRLSASSVVDFSTIQGFQATTLARIDDRLYTINSADGSLYQINPTTKSSVVVGQNAALKDSPAVASSSSGGAIYILTKSSGVFQYQPGGKLSAVRLSGGDWATGNALASYNGNLYILSPADQQIYRHSKTSIGFSASSSYVKRTNTASLAKAVALAINGSIFTTDTSSNITIFDNGIGRVEPVKGLPAKAAGVTQLQISGGRIMYALASDQQRIYQLGLGDDSISYTKQFTSTGLKGVGSFVVANDSMLYMLTGQKIIKASIK